MTAWHIAAMAAGCLLFSLVLGILVGRAIAAAFTQDAAWAGPVPSRSPVGMGGQEF